MIKGTKYEVVFSDEIKIENNLRDDEIREILNNGISLPKLNEEEFLLVIGLIQGGDYKAVILNKKIFNKQGGKYLLKRTINDILTTKHTANVYMLFRNALSRIQNSEVPSESEQLSYYDSRFFKEPVNQFQLFSNNEYTKAYLSRYLLQRKGKYNLTEDERIKKQSIITDAIDDNDLLNQFSKDIGVLSTDIIEPIKNNLVETINLYKANESIDELIKKYLLKDIVINQRIKSEIREEWEKETIQEVKDVESEISTLESILKETREKLDKLNTEFQQRANELNVIESSKLEIEQSLKIQLDEYNKTMMTIAETSGIISPSNVGASTVSNEDIFVNEAKVYTERSNDNYRKIITMTDFISNLDYNLSKYFDFGEDDWVASLITSSLLIKKMIVVPSLRGFQIASSLSVLLDGYEPSSIYIGSSNYSIGNIIKTIQESESKVVYIDGVLDQYGEQLINTLYYNINDKYIFLGVGNREVFRHISPYLWEYFVYIDFSPYYEEVHNDPLVFSDVDFEVLVDKEALLDKKVVTKSEEVDIFKKMNQEKILSKSLAIDFRNLHNMYSLFSPSRVINIHMVTQILLLNSMSGMDIQEVIEKLTRVGIPNRIIDKIKLDGMILYEE